MYVFDLVRSGHRVADDMGSAVCRKPELGTEGTTLWDASDAGKLFTLHCVLNYITSSMSN